MSEPSTPSAASPWLPADPAAPEPAATVDPATPPARWAPGPAPAPAPAPAPVPATDLADTPTAGPSRSTPAPPAARPVPAPPRPLPPSGRRTGPLQREFAVPAWLAALAAVTLVAAAVACVILATSKDDAPAAAAPAASSSLVRALRDPFELDGVRWATFVSPSQPWTAFASRVSPGPGSRWLLLAVRVRNLSRGRLDPAGLGYALVDDAGHRIAPDPRHSTAPGSGPVVPVGSPGQVDLAFRVPARATQLHLRFVTAARGGTAIDVPLGAS